MQNVTDTMIMPSGKALGSALGQYTLVREAGRGGMSVVHEARHTETGRTVAVKVLAVSPGLPPEQAQEMRARFEREARALAGLSHPNIVAIHELGEQAGHLFLVMEYLRGETLRQRLARGPLTPAQALPVLRQIADAVDAIHARGVVHRDIKPSNVMLLPDGTAKLLDFGIARQSDDATITGTGALVGSPAYMAPEQVRGGAGTPASDLWALGALLYEMLAGHPPFTGKSIPSVLYQVSHEDPASVAGLTTPVQRVLRRALDKNPDRRYPQARALAESLAAAASIQRAAVPLRPVAALALTMIALLALGVAVLRPRPLPLISGRSVTPPPAVRRAGAVAPLRPEPRSLRPRTGGAAVLIRRVHHRAAHQAPKTRAAVRSRRPMRTAKHALPSRPPHPKGRAARPRRSPLHHRTAARRVIRTLPPPHRGGDGFDAAASARLQKYIWPVGR